MAVKKNNRSEGHPYDVIVVGAGAVGCAVARELSRCDLRVAVAEKNSDVAGETTGRNSAVVHAGFNNAPGSLMASLCVEGNEGFEQICRDLDVPFRRTGKLVVAFDEQGVQRLEHLLEQGRANGCRGLEILQGEALGACLREHGMTGARMERGMGPDRCLAALWSPMTGITNPFVYCVALAENALDNGVDFFLDTEVTGIRPEHERQVGGFRVETSRGLFRCRYLVNCAGLQADRIAAMAGADSYRIWPCRGEYLILDRPAEPHSRDREELFRLPMPVYPVPAEGDGGLGVHLTPTMEGNILIGPSAEYLPEEDERENYDCTGDIMDELLKKADQLFNAIGGSHKRVPPVIGSYSGVRPKLTPPGEGGTRDFVICAEPEVSGLIDLVGIESPGLTASVPIARRVCHMIDRMEQRRRGQAEAIPSGRNDPRGAVTGPVDLMESVPGAGEPRETVTGPVDLRGTVPGSESPGGLLRKQEVHERRRGILRFREQSQDRQAQLIAEDPDYGEIICRCQKITRREILDAIENPLGARSLSAIKYRAWATTGRCNGGYCLPRIAQILVEEYGMDPEEICCRNPGSRMFEGYVK